MMERWVETPIKDQKDNMSEKLITFNNNFVIIAISLKL
jgi:hypothetical protein